MLPSPLTTWWNWLRRLWKSKGRVGEQIAVRYLTAGGYSILERNWRCSLGEIDIVAREGEALCIVEVKRRLSRRRGSPEEAVTPRKMKKLRQLAEVYRKSRRLPDGPMRIDVVAIDESSGRREVRLHRNVT